MRPQHAGRRRRPAAPARARQAAAAGVRVAQAAFVHPVGAAGRRQDDAGAAGGQRDRRHFIAISAVLAGIKDIRAADRRRAGQRSTRGPPHGRLRRRDPLVQQDAAGRLAAARRVGPAHAYRRAPPSTRACRSTNALLSRAQVLQPAAAGAGRLQRAATSARASTCPARRRSTPTRCALLGGYADGDARRLPEPAREQVGATPPPARPVDVDAAFARARRPARRCAAPTRAATQYYEQISAFHKSVRGSQPDAALYWLARMLDGGVDPRYRSRAA